MFILAFKLLMSTPVLNEHVVRFKIRKCACACCKNRGGNFPLSHGVKVTLYTITTIVDLHVVWFLYHLRRTVAANAQYTY